MGTVRSRQQTHKHEGLLCPGCPGGLLLWRCSTPCPGSWPDLPPVCLQAFPGGAEEHCPVKGFRSWPRLRLCLSQQASRSKGCHCPPCQPRYCSPSCSRCFPSHCYPSCPSRCCPRCPSRCCPPYRSCCSPHCLRCR